jgi:hypothetical protein
LNSNRTKDFLDGANCKISPVLDLNVKNGSLFLEFAKSVPLFKSEEISRTYSIWST